MKQPKKPSEPNKPHKPTPPTETISKQETLADMSIMSIYDGEYTFDEFVRRLIPKNLDVHSPNVFVCCSRGDYDGAPPWLTYYEYKDMPNPSYKTELAVYKKTMKAYEKKLPEYKPKMEAYKTKLTQYEIDYAMWETEQNRKALPKLEAQIKDLTKRVMAIKETSI